METICLLPKYFLYLKSVTSDLRPALPSSNDKQAEINDSYFKGVYSRTILSNRVTELPCTNILQVRGCD